MKISKVTIHCSDTENLRHLDISIIDQWHKSQNGWRKVGYHYVIQPNGTFQIGRDINEQGAHVEGHNRENIGICLIGRNIYTPHQFETLHHLLKELELKHGWPAWNLYCHNDFTDKKACPNMNSRRLLAWYMTQRTEFLDGYRAT